MSQNYLASRSSNLSSFNAIAMNYSTLTVSTLSGVSTLNVSRVITTSTIQVNSSMISLGASTNQVYISSLSYGNFSTSTKWNTSMIDRLSTATIAMSANAQYQMTVSPSQMVTSIMYTSTLGSSWATISAATGLPSATATSYTAGAISGDGQYAALGAYGGYLYRTANSGATWTNTNPNTPAIYLPLNGSVTDIIGTSNPSVQGANAGSISYVPGIVGTRAINLANATPGGTPTQFIRGSWPGSTNATISLWFNIQSTSITNSQTIFAAYQANLYIGIRTTNVVYITIPIATGLTYEVINGPIVANNTWYNIILIFQTNGLCSFYLNNQLIGTYTNAGIGSQATTLFSLGAYDNTNTNAFNGYIDDFKIYNSAISTPPSPMVPQNWSNVALSNSGQYMLATATGAGLYMSSNYGSTWTQVTGTMLSALWSAAQISASGQYMLAYSTPVMVQPQLTGLASSGAALTTPSWQTGGITWIANTSSLFDSTYPVSNVFNNNKNDEWVCAPSKYSTASPGIYSGTVSTNVIGQAVVPGEYVQIQSSIQLQIISYSIAPGSYVRFPNTYTIAGSNDGATWYLIQSVTMNQNPSGTTSNATPSSSININQSGSQTYTTSGGSATLTCTISSYTTNAYSYFRIIINKPWNNNNIIGNDAAGLGEWYINFQAGGQTYSTNYGSTWNNGYALPTPTALSLSESGQYAIGSNTPLPFSQLNFEDNYVDSANGLATGVPSGTTANVSTFSATCMVGSKSLIVSNTAAGATNLGYVNYTIPSGSPLSLPNALTIALWIRPNSTTSQSSPLGFNNGISVAGPYFYLASTMSFAYYTTTQQSGAITSTSAIPTGSWTHVALTFSGGLLSLYINGSVQATRTITGSLSLDASTWGPITNMFIGCLYTTGGGYNGLIDDVRIYTYPLPASTINAMYLLSAPVVNITSNFLQGFSTGTSTTPNFTTLLNAETNVPVASAVSNTGQYMVLITNNISGNNVYYSTNFGALFTSLQLGTTLLTSCAISYDGSYITVSNATTTWTLNNNSNGFSLALGNQAGYQNQGQNAIAIGNGAGIQNQTAYSIILNASPVVVNSFAPGFYVAPIATYVASSSQSFGLLGYGIDSQVVQIGNVSMTSNILTLNSGLSLTGTVYGATTASAAFWMQANGNTSLFITDSQNSATMGTTTMGRYFGYGGNIFQDFTGSFIWRTSNLSNTAVNHAMTLSSTGILTVSNVSIFGNSSQSLITIGENSNYSSGGGGANNMSIGKNVGRTAGTGSNNLLYGMSVGQSMTTASFNMFFGMSSGNAITTGTYNTCFGQNSQNAATTASYNTCFGTYTGNSLTTGNSNTFIGYNTGNATTTGTNNVAIGADVGGHTTGIHNVSIGGGGTHRILSSGNYNVAIGLNAGYDTTTGTYNICLGTDTFSSAGDVNNEIIIGAGNGKGSNSAFIRCSNNNFWLSGYTVVGTLGIVGAGRVQNGSDRDLKNNIIYLSNQGSIQKVLWLKPCTYELKLDKNPNPKVYTGFIAQDVDEVIPTAVDGRKYKYQYEQNADGSPKVDEEGNVVYMKDENGNKLRRYLGLNITDILATAVLAIQEQQTFITAQQTQIDTLIQRLTAANIA